MAGDPYSRLVAFLKVILPLIALGILSTLFLLSNRIQPGSSIPFAEGEVTDRVRGQQITGPVFSGVTTSGHRIAFKAAQIVKSGDQGNQAREMSARIDTAQGSSIVMVSDLGSFQLQDNAATLAGNVLIESSTGYRMRSDLLETSLSEVDVLSPGEVRATGPIGNFTAGTMQINAKTDGENVQLLFSQGVKLIYDPKESK